MSARSPNPPATQDLPGPQAADATDDELLAALYVRMWSLASGRELPRGIPLCQLSAEQLVDFWADDFVPATGGRHAAPTAGPTEDE